MDPVEGQGARYDCHAIGTGCTLVVLADEVVAEWRALLHAELERVDLLASRFRDDSELSALNRCEAPTVPASCDLLELLTGAMWAAEATQGAVDPTVGAAVIAAGYDRDIDLLPADRPGSLDAVQVPGWRSVELDVAAGTVTRPPGVTIDLGATAKAIASDRAARAIAAASGLPTLVSLGGDIAVAGSPATGWSIGVADRWSAPADATVAVRDGGVASSGTSARHWRIGGRAAHHLIDPRTGLPTNGPWRTATVVAADCLQANAASTAAIVKGPGALVFLESLELAARLVDVDGHVTTTAAWPAAEHDAAVVVT